MKRWEIVVMAGVLMMGGWLGITGLSAQASKAASQERNISPEKGKEGSAAAVALVNQAGDLVRYARENESPLAMLTAVQMIRRVRLQEGSARVGSKQSESKEGGKEAKESAKGQTPAPTLDGQKLLAEAKAWAKGDPHLLALIEAESAKPGGASSLTLSVVGGPINVKDRVEARTTDVFKFTFRGGELARIAVIGDGDTDLDLYVYDENESEIAKDVDRTDRCLVEWTPRRTGQFHVRIVNLGRVYNQYLLITN
jgi:hypothetical protein